MVESDARAAPRELFLIEDAAERRARPRTRAEIRAKLVMTLALWALSYVIFSLGSVLSDSDIVLEVAIVRAGVYAVGMVLCFALHLLLSRFAHRPFRTRAIIAAAVAPLIGECFAWVSYFAFAALQGRRLAFVVADWNTAAVAISLWTWFFIAWAGLYLAIEYSFEARHEVERSAELRSIAQNAKLRALSNQINPHFLFNSLNSISALILDGRSDEAERMLAGLSTYFRSTLSIDPLVMLPLEREVDLHRRYLAIEQMRYPDLVVDIALPAALADARVPAFIVQPLVENAIKHGVATSAPPTRIEIDARQVGDMLEISVTDRGNPDVTRSPPEGSGIGLANVRQRLEEYFGSRQALTLTAGRGFFEARIAMPLERAR